MKASVPMRVPVFTHPDCVRHDPGPDHPETPQRLTVTLARLAREPRAELRQASPADPEDLSLADLILAARER